MQVKLKVLFGKSDGKEVMVSGPSFVVGRSEECQLRPKSDAISRRHCEIKILGDSVTVTDLKSKNGTFVNDERIAAETPLKDGDRLKIGKLDFQILMPGSGLTTAISSPAEDTAAPTPVITERVVAAAPVTRSMAETTKASLTTHITSSKSDETDISDWLEEGDESARARLLAEPDTRQLRIDDPQLKPKAPEPAKVQENQPAAEEPEKAKGKPKPGKLPTLPKSTATDSRQAAADMLKKFFNRR